LNLPRYFLRAILLVLLLQTYAYALPTLYVRPEGAEEPQPNYFSTIQEAIDEAETGQKIYIYPGEYRENLNINGKDVYLIGSSPRTVLLIAPYTSPAISIYDSAGTAIENMTIAHESGIGDGLFFYHSSGHILRNIFRDNQVAINIRERSVGVFVEKNIFRDNYVGIRSERSVLNVAHNLFYQQQGPALEIFSDSLLVMNNNLLIYNDDYALDLKNAEASILNNTFAYNQQGVRIDLFSSGEAKLYNNIIAFNDSYGLNISALKDRPILADYNVLYGNGLAYYGLKPGPNDLASDPGFKDPKRRSFSGFQLPRSSPCRDKGSPDPYLRDADFSRNDPGFTGGPEAYWYDL